MNRRDKCKLSQLRGRLRRKRRAYGRYGNRHGKTEKGYFVYVHPDAELDLLKTKFKVKR